MAKKRARIQRHTTGDVLGDKIDTARLFDQVPPQDLEAEKAIIGGVMLANEAFDDTAGVITSGAFYARDHRTIWDAISDLYEADQAIDALTIASELEARGQLEEIGGPAYINQCLETVPHAGNTRWYAETVRDLWLLRKLIATGEEILKMAWTPLRGKFAGGAEEIIEAAESKVFNLVERSTRAESQTVAQILRDFQSIIVDRMAHGIDGLRTGFKNLDEILAGLAKGSLTILAARPSMGKTALVINTSEQIASDPENGVVVLFSLEQSKLEIAERAVVMLSKVNSHNLKTGNLSGEDQTAISEAYDKLLKLPLIVEDHLPQTPVTIASACRKIARKEKIACVIVDYLQLVDPSQPTGSREQDVSQVTRRLKVMARALNVPVIVLCQMNRGIEQRQIKRPMLSDLRESGAIEQDADVVIFLHRPDFYDPKDRPGEADLFVAKNRNGPLGTAKLAWIREQMRFRDLAEGERQLELPGEIPNF